MTYFTEQELSCPCCGVYSIKDDALARLNLMREILGRPMIINSAFRCSKHNKAVGGVGVSAHTLGKAFDVSLKGHDRFKVLEAARQAGFNGYGFYETFLHVDAWARRSWFDPKNIKAAKKAWKM